MTESGRNTPYGAGGWRRGVAIVALVGGVGLAYWQTSKGTVELEVALLLTHVELPAADGAAAIGARSQLVQVDVLIPRTAGSEEVGWQHSVRFDREAAPEATTPIKLTVPSDATEVKLRCTYQLSAAKTLLQTTGSAQIDTSRDELQVVDIGACSGT